MRNRELSTFHQLPTNRSVEVTKISTFYTIQHSTTTHNYTPCSRDYYPHLHVLRRQQTLLPSPLPSQQRAQSQRRPYSLSSTNIISMPPSRFTTQTISSPREISLTSPSVCTPRKLVMSFNSITSKQSVPETSLTTLIKASTQHL